MLIDCYVCFFGIYYPFAVPGAEGKLFLVVESYAHLAGDIGLVVNGVDDKGVGLSCGGSFELVRKKGAVALVNDIGEPRNFDYLLRRELLNGNVRKVAVEIFVFLPHYEDIPRKHRLFPLLKQDSFCEK